MACSGFMPFSVNALCVTPDGDTGLVSNNDRPVLLRHPNGECAAQPLSNFALVSPAGCAFDDAGHVYVVTRVPGGTGPTTRTHGQLQVIDTRDATPTARAIEWLTSWRVNHPLVLDDGRLLLERTGSDAEVETVVVDLTQQAFTRLSNTGAPVGLVDDRLYYIANDRALRVRLLDSEREATLVNGAVFATPLHH